MGVTQTTVTATKAEVPPKPYFYYPAYGVLPGKEKQGYYARRVLAGIVSDGKIHVGEARCYTGNYFKAPDQFNKKRGRQIAEARALAGKTVMTIDIPSDCTAIGKLFHTEVEKVYPKHVSTKKKKEEVAGPAPTSAEATA